MLQNLRDWKLKSCWLCFACSARRQESEREGEEAGHKSWGRGIWWALGNGECVLVRMHKLLEVKQESWAVPQANNNLSFCSTWAQSLVHKSGKNKRRKENRPPKELLFTWFKKHRQYFLISSHEVTQQNVSLLFCWASFLHVFVVVAVFLEIFVLKF